MSQSKLVNVCNNVRQGWPNNGIAGRMRLAMSFYAARGVSNVSHTFIWTSAEEMS
jgi:hypothetical protein